MLLSSFKLTGSFLLLKNLYFQFIKYSWFIMFCWSLLSLVLKFEVLTLAFKVQIMAQIIQPYLFLQTHLSLPLSPWLPTWPLKVSLLLLLLLSRFSRVRLFATPWMVAYQAPPSMGFSREEYWSGLPLPSPEGQARDEKPEVPQRPASGPRLTLTILGFYPNAWWHLPPWHL